MFYNFILRLCIEIYRKLKRRKEMCLGLRDKKKWLNRWWNIKRHCQKCCILFRRLFFHIRYIRLNKKEKDIRECFARAL